uniref:[histone H3]-lysine(4) N-trimethyltransferase n=1 Tax=Cynoglossus semilaevis TaxID=244447 RepID=A0A3P8VBY6_CYNSE
MQKMLKLERFVSPGKGNGVRANVALRRGQLVLSAEPLACCVSNRVRSQVCHHCFSWGETLKRCSQCKAARYCNAMCQKQAWSIHRRECKSLQRLSPRIPPDSVRLAARIIFALVCELYTVEEHESHLSLMSEQKKQGLSELASTLQLYLQQEAAGLEPIMTSALPPSCQDPLSLMAKIICNCFTICDKELQEIGVGLYPSLSLLNHDCRPNCVMMFDGPLLQLRAVVDIRPEEELTISYIETLSVTAERQKQLQDQYYFTCRCQLCSCGAEQDRFMLSGEEAKWQQLKEVLPELEKHKTQNNWETLLKSCRRLLSTVVNNVPDENVYKLKLTDMAVDACVHLQLWEEALSFGRKTLSVYKRYFPDPHPVHGVQLMRVGKLQHYLGHIQEALDTFRQAFQILELTHGRTHPLTTEVLTKMEECQSHAYSDCGDTT